MSALLGELESARTCVSWNGERTCAGLDGAEGVIDLICEWKGSVSDSFGRLVGRSIVVD